MGSNLAHTVTVSGNNVPLALHDYGGQGPAVLFVHGFLDGGKSFEDVALQAREFCRPMCLDWRGHGDSGRVVDGSYHQLDHFKDLLAVLDQPPAGVQFECVVAHSLGGTVALMLAATAPELFNRLLLLDCLGGYAADATTQVDQFAGVVKHLRQPQKTFRDFESRQAAEKRVVENNPGLSAAGAERIVRHYLEELDNGMLRVKLDPRLRGPNPIRYPEEHWQEMARRVSCPTTVVAPELGYMHRHPHGRDRFDCLAEAKWVAVPKVGHHVHVEVPELVVSELRELLK
ncbi:MAG: alpha/beta hydrolase [Planctomycetota bacterium]|nr:alpha/beta hydrolase [Planctomycetota bacterium]